VGRGAKPAQIAGDHDAVDAELIHLGKNRPQRDLIAMHVGEHGQALPLRHFASQVDG
jgi:hypothetical protein